MFIKLYFKENYKLITLELRKQQAFDADSKTTQQINFTGNLDRTEVAYMVSFLRKSKKPFWIFHKEL